MNKEATRDVYGKTLVELGKENKDIVVLDADLSGSTRTGWFAKEFPERFVNVGIAEQNLMGVAAGLALAGKIPFASTFAMFATGRCWEQIRNSIAYPRLNVKIVASHAGLTVGEDGATHQAIEDIAIMRTIPFVNVIVPSDAIVAKEIIRQVSEKYGPYYVRLSRSSTPVIYDKHKINVQIGKGNVLQKGKDVSIIACGIMVAEALSAAEVLSKEGISATVIDMYSIKPIDKDLIISAAKNTGAIVTAEEHTIFGGLGSAVSEVISQNHHVPIEMVGIKGVFGESGNPQDLLKKYGLLAVDIVRAVKEVVKRKKDHILLQV
jgi:transketolase